MAATEPQKLVVDESFSSNASLKLLDLPDELAALVLGGQTVFIKGGPEEDLVLCTSDSTYTLRFVESSNTMLLASASTAGGGPPIVRVQGSVGGIIEARRTYPAAAAVRAVLMTRPFVPRQPAEGDADSGAEDAAEEPEDEPKAAPPPHPEPPGDETLAAMPESELAAMFSMPQYEHTQPLDSISAAYGSSLAQASQVSDVGSGGAAGHKRRRGGGGVGRPRGAPGFSFAEILGRVQCSEAELQRALADVHAMRLGDAYVAVPEPLAREVATAALRCVAASGLSVDAVPVGAVAADLSASEGYCAELVGHALECTLGGRPVPGADGEAAALRLGFVALARFVGVGVLQSAGAVLQLAAPAAARALPVDAFLRAWASGMPVGTVLPSSTAAAGGGDGSGDGRCAGPLDLALLAGEVLLLDGGGGAGPAVLHLPATALSSSPPLRFRQLFSLRAKWRLADLEPFLAPLVSPGAALADLLLTHTRSSQQPDGSRLFSARV